MATAGITEALANATLNEPSALQQDGEHYEETGYLNLRSLVSTREAGVIIGKGGANVAAIRESTGVKAGVSKAIPGVQDRVLSVGGTAEEIAKAYSMVAQNLVDNSTNDQAAPASSSAATPTTVRLLVAHGVMGSIIGKQGAKIKQIQDSTSVRMVASKDLLPQSTERVVEITGAPSNIGQAVQQISECLVDESDRSVGTILFHPASVTAPGGGNMNSANANVGYNPSHPGGYGGLSALPLNNNATNYVRGARGGSRGGFRYPSGGRGGNANGSTGQDRRTSANQDQQQQQRYPAADDPNLKTQNISFPADMIGCIIGRGGSKISEIRKQSGSRINISKEPNPENGERLFSIIGTTESNERALFLLYSSLEKEKERRDKEQAPAQE